MKIGSELDKRAKVCEDLPIYWRVCRKGLAVIRLPMSTSDDTILSLLFSVILKKYRSCCKICFHDPETLFDLPSSFADF